MKKANLPEGVKTGLVQKVGEFCDTKDASIFTDEQITALIQTLYAVILKRLEIKPEDHRCQMLEHLVNTMNRYMDGFFADSNNGGQK